MSISSDTVQKAWNKATIVQGYDSNLWRQDQCGAWIYRYSYGKTSEYGWELDHITPKSKGGSDLLSNLRALHWQNNRSKSDGRLVCVVP
ncbi:HNH endonuclease signature motif containing protein [Leptolyngbya sp. AN03gr2]|uniref:HNH endonuclease signature motif containing protein n=1 Tax=unclassified Leptolyngbya TaxID=2650499 RepID=UPI003D32458E